MERYVLSDLVWTMEKRCESVQVVGLGQVCVDYVGHVPDYPTEDTKVELEGLFTGCGGPAATALVTLTRWGVRTSFLGSISDDAFGLRIVEGLQNEGVDISLLNVTPGLSSQFAFIAVSREAGQRTIFWQRSSAPELSPGHVGLEPFPNARILHVDGLMLEAAQAAAEQAVRRNMTVVMDAGTLRQGSLDLISRVHVLIASEPFAHALAGTDRSYEEVLQELREMGPRQVVITLGAKGSVGLDPDGIVRQAAFPVVSKNTTGAGDVYHGAYIYGLLKGYDMAACMAFASAAAALKCQNGRGWEGIPDKETVNRLLRQGDG